ncbi:hypothetical protein IID24_05745 [Patescibacteria group bacterium]|nr:hypothetical protein [Patescibacteria group bacterium]
MRIAQVVPLWVETPPQTWGGTPLIASLLTEELVKRGHKVTLFATGDSKTKAKLIPIWPKGLLSGCDFISSGCFWFAVQRAVREAE